MEFIYRRSYRGPLKAVILDWAGTVIDYGCMAPALTFVELFRRNGIEITIEQARKPMGMNKKDHIREITRLAEVDRAWQDIHGAPCTEADVDSLYRDYMPLQIECLTSYSRLIDGSLVAVKKFRKRALLIGTTTGYSREMIDILSEEARKQGFVPDSIVCASDVPAGRPHPWMCVKAAMDLQVYPMEAIVKIGDTPADVEEGLNAGMWTIGIALTGNELGMTEDEVSSLAPDTLRVALETAYRRLFQAGAHYVVDTIAECDPVLDIINARLFQGERP
jgi:phosphonoacetaldehyde hydrolase